jgi:AMIN domain-containing protein
MFALGRSWIWAGCCVCALVQPPLALAQTTKPAPAPGQRFAIPGSPDSVSPGKKSGGAPPEGGKKTKKSARGKGEMRPRPGAPVATFPGFRLLPSGGSRIYVELTKSVTVDERRANGALVFKLRGAQVLSRNNKNPLITTNFATPVARARLVPAGLDLDLVIDLRKAVEATHQVVAGDNGTARLEIDFPAGDYPLVPGLYQPPAGARRSDRDEVYDELPPEAPAPSTAPTPAAPPTGAGPPNP